MKKQNHKFSFAIFALLALFASGIYAAVTTSLTQKQVRDPRVLETILEANFTDLAAKIVQSAAVTAGTNATQTVTFATVFGAAPIVSLTYTEDPGDVRPAFVTSVTTSNFVANITADKNFGYVAHGTR